MISLRSVGRLARARVTLCSPRAGTSLPRNGVVVFGVHDHSCMPLDEIHDEGRDQEQAEADVLDDLFAGRSLAEIEAGCEIWRRLLGSGHLDVRTPVEHRFLGFVNGAAAVCRAVRSGSDRPAAGAGFR